MEFIVWTLILGALIAAIWGRHVAQGFVPVVLSGAAILLGRLTLIVGVLLFTVKPTDMGHGAGD